jgi:DNA end-binding protein Ku
MALGDALVLELLRYSQELRNLKEFEFPSGDSRQTKVSKKEVELATQLIDGMTARWDASKYHDEYRDVLMKLIERKIKTGQTEAIEMGDEAEPEEEPQTIDFMEVLKESVAHASKDRGRKPRTPKKKASARRRKTSKRRAG